MLWPYERKFVTLPRQKENSGSAFRVNKNQSYRGRLTTRTSPILLTRQLGTVVRRKTDNPNQRTTSILLNGYKECGEKLPIVWLEHEKSEATLYQKVSFPLKFW